MRRGRDGLGSSCPGLSRASTLFAQRGGACMAGTSPAMTLWNLSSVFPAARGLGGRVERSETNRAVLRVVTVRDWPVPLSQRDQHDTVPVFCPTCQPIFVKYEISAGAGFCVTGCHDVIARARRGRNGRMRRPAQD